MSKDLFQLMREEEVATANFLPSKKELQNSSKAFARQLIHKGEVNLYEVYSQARRLKESLDIIEKELKDSLPDESFESFGIKGNFKNGGSVANYSDDTTYSQIKKQLDDRKTLLDTALKTDETIYDSEGVEVPKVSKTQRKSNLSITF
jgi:membrane carboxypeptidase/penicillin-binding protein